MEAIISFGFSGFLFTVIKSSHEMGCMLTVRLLAKDGSWVWVNMVMHIRQPFICDNGDPAIVCVNQVISDSEAELFRMQSQLESSHIARSPEFLNPVQGSSPSHNIIQVPAETEQQMQSIGFMSLLTGTTYEAQVTFAPTTEAGSSTAGSPQQGTQLASMPTMQHGSGSGSVSDSSSDGAGSPSVHKQKLRAEILNRINLKNLKRGATGSVTPCKPAKRAKVTPGSTGNGGSTSISGSVVITSVPASSNIGSQVAGGYGSAQVLAQVAPGQLFADLSLKKEVMIPESVKALGDFTQPLTPPTPASSDRADSPATEGMTKLTVDCSGTSLLPLGLLTPENSPTWEECTTIIGSQTEQQVPTLCDLDDALQITETENEVSILKPSQIKVEKSDADALCFLPELDTVVIEKYFEAVDRRVADIKVDIKSEPLSPPQSSVGSPGPVPSPSSSCTESVASPASYASSVTMSPASQVAMSPASAHYTSVPSPVSQPAAAPDSNNKETVAAGEGLPSMSEAQLTSLVNTVTEAILDMVKQNQGGNQVVSTAAAAAATTSDVTGGFMLISGNSGNKTDDLPVEVPDVEMVESPMSQDSPLPDPIAEAALLDELHQLDQLASAAPSYGEFIKQCIFFKVKILLKILFICKLQVTYLTKILLSLCL